MAAHSTSQQPSAALALSGTFSNPQGLTERLAEAAARYHLIAPAPSCELLPEGHSVSLSAILIDTAGETYAVGGGGDDDEGAAPKGGAKLGLSKVALDRIASAAGVNWDPHLSRRLDDGRDRNYCMVKAVGYVKQWDGSPLTLCDVKELDFRDGSPHVEAMWGRYESKLKRWESGGRRGYAPRSPESQLAEQRQHILSLAMTKARLRAIRTMGIKTAYTAEELKKPFVIARLMFDGHSDDPAIRMMFAQKRADAALGGARSLYGAGLEEPHMKLAAPISAPPVGSVPADDDDFPAEPRRASPVGGPIAHPVGERVGEPVAPHGNAPPPPPPAAQAQPGAGAPPPPSPQQSMPYGGNPAPRPAPPQRPRSGLTIPGGRARGTPIETADDRDIAYWADRIGEELKAGTSRDGARDAVLCNALNAERDWRLGIDPDDRVPF